MAVGNDVREYLNVSFLGDCGMRKTGKRGREGGGGGGERLRNGGVEPELYKARLCMFSLRARTLLSSLQRPPVASGTITRSNSSSRHVCTCVCAHTRVHAHLHAHTACMHTGRACGRAPLARRCDRSQKLRNESPRALTLARRPPKSRLSSFRRATHTPPSLDQGRSAATTTSSSSAKIAERCKI